MTNTAEIIRDEDSINQWRIVFHDAEGRSSDCPVTKFIETDETDDNLISYLKDMTKWCRFDTISAFSVVR